MNDPRGSYRDRMVSTINAPVAAFALVWLAGSPIDGTVLCCMDVMRLSGRSKATFKHALELEQSFVDTVIGFEDQSEPSHTTAALDMRTISERIGLRRVLCAVVVAEDGSVHAGRNYDEVEVTRLEAVREQLSGLLTMPIRDAA